MQRISFSWCEFGFVLEVAEFAVVAFPLVEMVLVAKVNSTSLLKLV
jgi:hypothetical protein